MLPVFVYLAINLVEAQFVTPMVVGRTMTLNPFIVVLALIFWIWLWGPLGGFVAIPAVLVVYAILETSYRGSTGRSTSSTGSIRARCSGRLLSLSPSQPARCISPARSTISQPRSRQGMSLRSISLRMRLVGMDQRQAERVGDVLLADRHLDGLARRSGRRLRARLWMKASR